MDERVRKLYTEEEIELSKIADFIHSMELVTEYFGIDLKDLMIASSKSDLNVNYIIMHPYIFPKSWNPEGIKEEFLERGVDLETLPYYRPRF